VPDFRCELPVSVRSMIRRSWPSWELRIASYCPQPACRAIVDSAVVARVVGINSIELEERLEMLDRVHGWFGGCANQEFPDATITVRTSSVHILYQNALYAALQPARRAAWSLAVAQALLAHHGEQCSAIAGTAGGALRSAPRLSGGAGIPDARGAQCRPNLCAARGDCPGASRAGASRQNRRPAECDRQELRLQTVLIGPLQILHGYASEEVKLTSARARAVSKRLGGSAMLCRRSGAWLRSHLMRGEVPAARQLTEEFLVLAETEQDPAFLLLANQMHSTSCSNQADFHGALKYARQAIDEFDPQLTDRLIALSGRHPW